MLLPEAETGSTPDDFESTWYSVPTNVIPSEPPFMIYYIKIKNVASGIFNMTRRRTLSRTISLYRAPIESNCVVDNPNRYLSIFEGNREHI